MQEKHIHIIEITETLTREVTIEALSFEEALITVKRDYVEQNIILNSDDYIATEFTIQSGVDNIST